jgi:6-phosphofructokinase 1
MGRNCGYLAIIASIVGGAEIVSVPEREVSMESIHDALADAYVRGKSHAVAVIAEGVSYKTTDLVEYLNKKTDVGFEVRLTILGHIQRGGSPSAFDRLLATRMGVKALEVLRDGQSGVMVALDGRDLTTVPIEQAIAHVKPINPNYFELARMLSR